MAITATRARAEARQRVRRGVETLRWAMVPTLLVLAAGLSGCGRSLTLHQDPYINTACHENRPPDQRTGDPLELNIVVVYPSDLKKPGNELLRPDSKITSKDWYARRPQADARDTGRFDLPRNQIYVLAIDEPAYGRRIGSALRGAALDGDKPIRKSGIALKWDTVHNDDSVIYVFPRFTDRNGEVLPVLPAKFCPPGAFTADLEVKIGVQPDRRLAEAQYVRVLSQRKLHGSER